MKPLLAKSLPKQSLLDHTRDVVAAFEHLFGTPGHPTRLGDRLAAFFKLPSPDAFLRNGLAAAWTHDWGKANDRFAGALTGRSAQLIHHAHLSALLLNTPALRTWLKRGDGIEEDVVLAAVFGHHLNASSADLVRGGGGEGSMAVWTAHPDFVSLMTKTAVAVGIDGPPPAMPTSYWSYAPDGGETDLEAAAEELSQRLNKAEAAFKACDDRRRLLGAVRAGLIAADAAGSGLFRVGQNIGAWIDNAFDRPPLDGDAIRGGVIRPRIADVERRSGRAFEFTTFQNACTELPDRALLLAPCGSGKTLAAWQWIAARLDAKPAARVIFLYPTRGTATEGFRDYVAWAPAEDAALVHKTATYESDGLFENPDDPRHGKFVESQDRLFALRQWPKRVFSATVDQFLAFLQYAYAPVCHLPLLADSVVVVDEVHSFDRGMFSAIKDFLKQFDVPVLCMTATLPPERRQALESCGLTTYPDEMPDDLRQSATYPRYRVRRTTDDAAPAIVRQALRQNRRVLWVVNTVQKCQDIARTFAKDEAVDAKVMCYHSRFKLVHRNRRHKAVVEAFRSSAGPRTRGVLAVTTQVCEMSLDLDADVVVTELAPATSLVQRMGRGCREVLPKNGRTADVWVIGMPVDKNKPYTPEQLKGVDTFVDRAAAFGVASQNDLDTLLNDVPFAEDLHKFCRFLESGPWAKTGEESFRDTDDVTRPAVLPEDVERYVTRRRGDRSYRADGLGLPVPKKLSFGKRDARLPLWLSVADGGYYDKQFGYLDEQRPPEGLVV